MDTNSLIILLIVGAVAGWLAGLIMGGRGFGIVGNIVLGIIGSFLGGWVFGMLRLSIGRGLVGSIITSTVGAIIVLSLARALRRA
jgi:uncharacterized membrane protein YeaQ/YmgE (transglycosylase-associated protein family)